MAITFQTESQARTYEKVGCYLTEMGISFQNYVDLPAYRVSRGSAQAIVEVVPAGDAETLVIMASRVVSGARIGDPELMRTLLTANAERSVGGFCYNSEGDIGFTHSLIGSSCTRAQLSDSIAIVTTVADEWDDKICEKWGGKRAVEPPAPRQEAKGEPDPGDVTVRVVHPPTAPGIGDGKVFYFLFGFRRDHEGDQAMMAQERKHLEDDIANLTAAGYQVVVEPRGTRDALLEALYEKGKGAEGLPTAGIYWSGHGMSDGTLQTSDEGLIKASDVEAAKVSSALRLLILSSCYVGSRARTWRKSLGGQPLVVGWGRPVTIERALEFLDPHDATETDFDDLLRRYVLAHTALPVDAGPEEAVAAESEIVSGSVEGLMPRLRRVAETLHAPLTLQGTHASFRLTLEDGHSHDVRASLVHSNEPYLEGDPLLGVEADVGELSAVVEPASLLAATRGVGYGRVTTVKGETEAPKIVFQGFLPLARTRDQDLAALIFQVAERASALSKRIFGRDAA